LHFKLDYTGSPGNVTARLRNEADEVVGAVGGLANERAARRWARTLADEIKAKLTPVESRAHAVYTTLAGHDHFNI